MMRKRPYKSNKLINRSEELNGNTGYGHGHFAVTVTTKVTGKEILKGGGGPQFLVDRV